MVEAFIALGSNLGNRQENLKKALQTLGERLIVLRSSSVYETEPMYVEDQNWFLNCVVKVSTELSPRPLLEVLKEIELGMGRKTSNNERRFGPRIIDIDILFYDDQIVSEGDLKIPHPRIQERLFVLVPLAEIEPGFLHPSFRKSISELISELHSEKKIVKL
jgi:2-amino-4-hydroxy-6-hydroxymethyldihydropteridine diphosphokinase